MTLRASTTVCCLKPQVNDDPLPLEKTARTAGGEDALAPAAVAQLMSQRPLPAAEGLYHRDSPGSDRRLPPLMVGQEGLQVLRGSRIGRGSFAKVYLGVDRSLRPVVVRVHRLPERGAQRGAEHLATHGPGATREAKTFVSTRTHIAA